MNNPGWQRPGGIQETDHDDGADTASKLTTVRGTNLPTVVNAWCILWRTLYVLTDRMAERVARLNSKHMLERNLGELTDRCRRLVNMLYYDLNKPSYSEITELMGMPESSIGQTRARCLEKLGRTIL